MTSLLLILLKWVVKPVGAKIVYYDPSAPNTSYDFIIATECQSFESPGNGTWFFKDPYKF